MEEKLIEVIKDALEIEGDISFEDKLENLEGWDSLGILTVSAGLNEAFEVTLNSDDFQSLVTVNDLLNFIKKKIEN